MHSLVLLTLGLAVAPAAAATQVLHVGAVADAEAGANTVASLSGKTAFRRGGAGQRALRASVADGLPPGWRLGAVQWTDESRPHATQTLGQGPWQAQLTAPAVPGRNLVALRSERDGPVQAYAWAQLAQSTAAASKEAAVHRGQEVMVVVRSGNVMVQAKGIAQQAAALGEMVVVLPHSSTHTVQAMVRDDATVEVNL